MEFEKTSKRTASGGGLQGGDLPDWFLFELLARLPIDDVFRFNCVSKRFTSFISDPSFRAWYISRLPSHDQFMFFPTRIRRRGVNHDGTALKYPERHLFTLPTPPLEGETSRSRESSSISRLSLLGTNETWSGGGSFYTVADDKGFLLVSWVVPVKIDCKQDRCRGEFFICSAITHQWFSLPSSPPNLFVIESVGFVTKVDESGRFLTSYRVVIIDFTVENIVGTLVPDYVDLQVFVSEATTWASVRLQIGSHFMFNRWLRPVLLNSTVYWTDPSQGILGYDPYIGTNKFRFIKPPHKDVIIDPYKVRVGYWLDYSTCGVCLGKVKYFEHIKSMDDGSWKFLRIWELQENNQWHLQHTIRMKDVDVRCFPTFDFKPRTVLVAGALYRDVDSDDDDDDNYLLHTATFLSFDQLDPDIVYLNMLRDVGVASCNIRTKHMELLDPRSFMKGGFATVGNYRWFLLKLPSWPILIPPYLMCKN